MYHAAGSCQETAHLQLPVLSRVYGEFLLWSEPKVSLDFVPHCPATLPCSGTSPLTLCFTNRPRTKYCVDHPMGLLTSPLLSFTFILHHQPSLYLSSQKDQEHLRFKTYYLKSTCYFPEGMFEPCSSLLCTWTAACAPLQQKQSMRWKDASRCRSANLSAFNLVKGLTEGRMSRKGCLVTKTNGNNLKIQL